MRIMLTIVMVNMTVFITVLHKYELLHIMRVDVVTLFQRMDERIFLSALTSGRRLRKEY